MPSDARLPDGGGYTVTGFDPRPDTATRAQNLWTAGADGYGGLDKAGMEWVKSTAAEVAAKLPHDPALGEVREEIDFYFPSVAKVDAAAKPAQL